MWRSHTLTREMLTDSPIFARATMLSHGWRGERLKLLDVGLISPGRVQKLVGCVEGVCSKKFGTDPANNTYKLNVMYLEFKVFRTEHPGIWQIRNF